MRTEYCGTTDARYLGQVVTLYGWAHRRCDHGGVIFIDLRDREGLAQVVGDPDRADTFAIAVRVRNEFVLRVKGVVRRRPEGTVNPALRSGEIEVLAHELEILNPAAALPFMVDEEHLSEEVRLKHRYLDLRREPMQRALRLRHAVARATRRYLDDNGFIDSETPVLYKSTPEGAREFLVPSRLHAGHFYALPQSPQLFKQLLMVAGFDRYYQIVKCFRDEDLRADRQPEFTQIDIETSFLDERAIQQLMEGLIVTVFRDVLGVDLPQPFPRLAAHGAKGLAYIKVNDRAKIPDGLQSPIVKFLSADVLRQVLSRTGAENGDVIFFGADKAAIVNAALGALRVKIAEDKNLFEKGWRPLWVVDFPM